MLLRRYHNQGVQNEVTEEPISEAKEAISEAKEATNVIVYDDITKSQMVDILSQKGIEHNHRDKKEDLYNLLLGSE